MAEITAAMVKELRERTDLGMMECKKALVEANGDMAAAEDLLRIKSGAKAGKAASRVAAEGVIGSFVSNDSRLGTLVEVNCETDFVAKNDDFIAFAQAVAGAIAERNPADVAAAADLPLASGSVEETRKALVMKLGENITLRRFARIEAKGRIAVYLHGTKIGVMVDYSASDPALGKDIAMHIAASKPICVNAGEVPVELLAKEREIYSAQAAESGKPANIIEKMVEGRVSKYLAEVTLLGQPFVKNPDQTVEKLLAEKKAEVHAFKMFVVGQGIEKKVTDFAAEVAAQAGA